MGKEEREGGRAWKTEGGEGGREWAKESGREVGSGRRRRGEM